MATQQICSSDFTTDIKSFQGIGNMFFEADLTLCINLVAVDILDEVDSLEAWEGLGGHRH